MKPGLYKNLSNEEYHAAPGISKSGLDLIARCPSIYKHRVIDGNRPEPTAAMLLGSAVHKAVLEPGSFSDEFVFAPEINRRTKAGKYEWAQFQADNANKTVLPKGDYEKIMRMSDSVLSHPKASDIFSHGDPELSIFHNDRSTGELAKVRPDWSVEDVVVDLKTTLDASPDAFSKACFNFRYHVQAAFYMDVFQAETAREINNFIYVVVEKSEPYQVAVYVADQDMIELGRVSYRDDLDLYARCTGNNHWPGYADDVIQPIGLPGWAFR